MTPGQRVKIARTNAKLTQSELGAYINVKKSAIANIENGINALSYAYAHILCEPLGVNAEWLLTGKGEMNELVNSRDIYFDISQRIKTVILSKDQTVESVAKLLNVETDILNETLQGKRFPTLEFVHSFLQIFPDVSTGWMITGDGNMHDPDSFGNLSKKNTKKALASIQAKESNLNDRNEPSDSLVSTFEKDDEFYEEDEI